jgi:hypothetical protein
VQQEADSLTNEYNFQIGDLLMASTYLTRTATSGNRQIATFSGWIKKGSNGVDTNRVFLEYSTSTNYFEIRWRSVDNLRIYEELNGGTGFELITNRLFRDNSAWYHIVVEIDTTQATASDRIKLYINGVQETSFSTETYPSQNYNVQMNVNSKVVSIGAYQYAGSNYFNGSMSHLHWIDGTAYDATAFGQFDANGVWKIKTSPSVTYGTNGFFILKDGNSVTDQSVNSNNWTVGGGTLTNTEDNPSNVFATLNPLVNIGTNTTYSQGNNTVSTNNANYKVSPSTLAVSSGKWYMEFKAVSGSFGSIDAAVGILQTDTNFSTGSQNLNAYPNGYSYGSLGKVRQYNASDVYTASTYADGDIIGIALDMDNNKLYFHKNGTYQNSGDPTSGSTGTGAVSITSGKEYYFACSTITSSGTKVFSANFGNGYFGTTAVASAGTNASGIGIFEYDVPTGYTALSTKGLDL